MRKSQIAPNDLLLANYCDQQSFMLRQLQNNPQQLTELKKSLTKHLEAVSSEEIKAIKKEMERLQSMKQSFFGYGPVDANVVNKINLIKDALSKVPLLERIHAFSNVDNEHCNKVRVALAEHRHWFRSSALTEGKVDLGKTAARSFDNLHKQFKNAHLEDERDAGEKPQERPN